MKTHCIHEDGIRLWEETSHWADDGFSTITLIAATTKDVVSSTNALLAQLGERWEHWWAWVTLGYILDCGPMRQKIITRAFDSEIGSFRRPVVQKIDDVYCSVARIELPLVGSEVFNYRDRRLLVNCGLIPCNEKIIFELMRNVVKGYDAKTLSELHRGIEGLLTARCYEDVDTHAVIQWFGREIDIRILYDALLKQGVVPIKSKNSMAELLK